MGKRKHREEDEEDYLERKIRSLERKRLKIRRRRRHRSYSPSTSSYTDNEYEYADQDIGEPDPLLEDSQYEESPLTNNTVYDLTDDEVGASTSGALPAAGGLRSVVIQNRSAAGPRAVDAPAPAPPPAPAAAAAAAPACAPAAATTTPAAPAPAPTSAATTLQVTGEQIGLQESTPIVTALDPGLLCLLGDEPVKEETFGPCIHDDISTRWSDILVNAVVGVAAAASPESPDASEDELHAWRAQTAAAVPPRERPPSAAAAAAHPDLAPLASDADTQPQCRTQAAQEPYPGCRSVVRAAFMRQGTPAEAADIMLASLTETTLKQYNCYLKKWYIFCKEKCYDIFDVGVAEVLDYFTLLFNQGCQFGSINTAKAVL
ncbi:uncharacterized protein LOC125242007 [Leguminivora glycinivorella]|uniref:uncharacterized protein LOC125242007 n=1 Tax=Leguminivora glycinivorella TaxID=1035111 RepID=UPI002010A838|nr:uncharacterized protein LOC125242007 [Leguminivora glycinivorella]